jgi:hypothetical protein
MQPDLFTTSQLVGLAVDLSHTKLRCHDNIATIAPGKGPHVGEFKCAACGAHRGWLSKATGKWIEDVIERFGRPTVPLVFRSPQK